MRDSLQNISNENTYCVSSIITRLSTNSSFELSDADESK